jgi:glucokinase
VPEKYLGVNFSGREVKLGIVQPDGAISGTRYQKVGELANDAAAGLLINTIDEYLQNHEGPRPKAIGLGLVGVFDRNKRWLSSINANITTPVDIRSALQSRFGLPAEADNDVYATTLAIKHFDIGRITDHFIVFHVGTGVAAGIVCDGRIVRGVGNFGGEIGHMCVDSMGEPCRCGHHGCLENIVCSHRIIEQAEELIPLYPNSPLGALKETGALSLDALFESAQIGDELAGRVVRRAVQALGTALVNLVNLLSPEHIVFSGEVVNNPYIFERVRKYMFDYCMVSSLNTLLGYSISNLRENGRDIYGAASLCFPKQPAK